MSTASPTPFLPTSSTGAPSARATVALLVRVMEPTAGYPTPSITSTFRPRPSSSQACRTSDSISPAEAVSPARKARVKPE